MLICSSSGSWTSETPSWCGSNSCILSPEWAQPCWQDWDSGAKMSSKGGWVEGVPQVPSLECGQCTSILNSSSTHSLLSEFQRKKRQFLLNVTPCLQIHMYIDRLYYSWPFHYICWSRHQSQGLQILLASFTVHHWDVTPGLSIGSHLQNLQTYLAVLPYLANSSNSVIILQTLCRPFPGTHTIVILFHR